MKKFYMLMVFALTAVAATVLVVAQAGATGNYASQTGKACGYCHVDPAGGGTLTAAGTAFKNNGHQLPTTTTTARATTTTTAAATTTTTAGATTTTTARATTTTTAGPTTTTTARQTTTTTAGQTAGATTAPRSSDDASAGVEKSDDTKKSHDARAYRDRERRSAEHSRGSRRSESRQWHDKD